MPENDRPNPEEADTTDLHLHKIDNTEEPRDENLEDTPSTMEMEDNVVISQPISLESLTQEELLQRQVLIEKTEKEIQDYLEQYYQIGVAQYLGDYGDLHTWIMLKSKKNSLENNWATYPVLKFFKGNTLLEIGYHKKTNWDIHLMYRF